MLLVNNDDGSFPPTIDYTLIYLPVGSLLIMFSCAKLLTFSFYAFMFALLDAGVNGCAGGNFDTHVNSSKR